jgi:hypothetical protein
VAYRIAPDAVAPRLGSSRPPTGPFLPRHAAPVERLHHFEMMLQSRQCLLREIFQSWCATTLGIGAKERDGLFVRIELRGQICLIGRTSLCVAKFCERRLLLRVRLFSGGGETFAACTADL